MGKTNRTVWMALLVLAGLGIGGMAATNPDQLAYEQYATQTLSARLESRFCADLPDLVTQILQADCGELIRRNQSVIQEMVHAQTQRRNFLLFSLYTTTFAIPGIDLLPTYQVDTLGIFNQFLTYRAIQR